MAKLDNGSLLDGISGELAGLVFKKYSYGTVASKKPDMTRVKKSERQKLECNKFRDAVEYAREITRNRVKKAEYAKRLPKGKTVYHAAISEYMKRA